MGTRLYIGNLPFTATATDVRDAFAAAGTVVDVRLVTDRETGRSRGFAFVTMGSADEAERAIAKMNGVLLAGRPLRVSEAQERAPRPFGSVPPGARGGAPDRMAPPGVLEEAPVRGFGESRRRRGERPRGDRSSERRGDDRRRERW